MALSNVLAFMGYTMEILPLIKGFMNFAEETEATGEIKKSTTVNLLKGALKTGGEFASGEAKQIIEFAEMEGGMVDQLATLFFGSEEVIVFEDEDHAN